MSARDLPPVTGVDEDGLVVREGDLARVPPAFARVVAAFEDAARTAFDADPAAHGGALHSLYLYGSIPRGTAQVGTSDLDGQVLLTREPTDDDRALVRRLEADLGRRHPEVSHVGILLDSFEALTHPADRHDGGFHLRVLCTPLWGPDAGELVAPHRVDLDLARGVQTGWREAIARLRERVEEVASGPRAEEQEHDQHDHEQQEREVCRATGRRLARVAFSWLAPRWGGWSSDPGVMREVVTALEPDWAEPMAEAVELGWGGRTDLAAAHRLLDGWARELQTRGDELGTASPGTLDP